MLENMSLLHFFDLQSIVSNNLTNTCTSEKCFWKRRNRKSYYAVLNIVKYCSSLLGQRCNDSLKVSDR